jgi:branched-chain amino acid transport system permease protein
MTQRAIAAALALVILGLIAETSAAEAAGAPSVDRQAWAQTTTVPVLGPAATSPVYQSGHLYVATTAGTESARAFIHVDTTGLDRILIEQSRVVLTEVSAETIAPAGAPIAACALAQPFSQQGQLHGALPAVDCSVRVDATRAADGHWSVELGVFARKWSEEANDGFALLPAVGDPSTTFRVAFDASKSTVEPSPVAPPSSPTTTPDTFAQSVAAPPPSQSSQTSPPASTIHVDTSNKTGAPATPTTTPRATTRPVTRPVSAASPSPVPFFLLLIVVALVGVTAQQRRLSAGALASGGRSSSTPVLGWGGAFALALVPMLFNEVTVYNAGLVLIFVIAALGLHLLVNWAGQLSLAHAGMVGLPALVVIALSETHQISPLYLLPVGAAIGALTGVLVSLPAMRAQGLQIALVTLMAGIAINRFFLEQEWLVGAHGTRSAALPALGPFSFRTSKDLYVVLLVVVGVTLLLFWALMHSKLGRAWLWIAAHPDAASAFGVPVATYKIAAYGAAGAFAGIGGAMTVAWVRQLSPQAFPTTLSFTYLLIAVLAGAGFAGGVLVAALVITGGPLVFSSSSSEVNRVISYVGPVALIANLTVYKAGLNGAGRDLMQKLSGLTRVSNGRGLEVESGAEDIGAATTAGRGGRAPAAGSIAAAAVVVAGFLAITLAWYHSGNTDQVWIQNQELVSGGIGGLALVILGVGLLLRDELRQRDLVLRDALERVIVHEVSARAAARVESSLSDRGTSPRRRTRPLVVTRDDMSSDA